ncbi:MAG: hypothetical protein OXH59_06200 [Rhodospirillaceae bacterium]|nr:hypothetical protein [Rhodospirillaceae bacterium]
MRRPAAIPFAMILAVLLAGMTTAASAKDLGVRGATWPVAEPDLLEQIETRLLDMQQSGALARLEEDTRTRARQRLEEPQPVPGIAPAREERSRLFDPAVTVATDIRTPDGFLIAAAGTRVNPLTRLPLTRDLIFIDGRRDAEIAWALARERENGRPAKIVLLAGRPLDLMRRHRRPFFFDTGGRLAARFAIAATPTLIEQDGAQLRLTEIPIKDPGSPSGLSRLPDPTRDRLSVQGTGSKLETED